MNRIKKIALTLTLALAVAAGGVVTLDGTVAVASGGGQGKVIMQDTVAKKGSFDITEVEQLAGSDGSKNGDVPVVPGVAMSSDGPRTGAGCHIF